MCNVQLKLYIVDGATTRQEMALLLFSLIQIHFRFVSNQDDKRLIKELNNNILFHSEIIFYKFMIIDGNNKINITIYF